MTNTGGSFSKCRELLNFHSFNSVSPLTSQGGMLKWQYLNMYLGFICFSMMTATQCVLWYDGSN